jgi:pyruvate,water dikinase
MVRTLAVIRKWHLILADRFVARGWIGTPQQYFLLQLEEVASAIAGALPPERLREIVGTREEEFERNRRIDMPLLMRESDLAEAIEGKTVSIGETDGDLRGTPTSPGCIEAEVAVINDPGDFANMKRGAILVARATDPSWTPLFTLASGVIVELGGVLSHASTVAREFGLPALANVKHATKRLRTGERVLLNASEGYVRRIAGHTRP